MANHIPDIVLHPQFVGTTGSTDFYGPIARPVSGDFRHFFAQIATEYDADPNPTVAENSGLGGTSDSADFQGPITSDPFLMIFAIFSLKSPSNTMLTPSQQWQTWLKFKLMLRR